jgi:GNAT superfamily N-acetyltransferase
LELIAARETELQTAMEMINAAKKYLRDSGVDQWQRGYPDEACIRQDLQTGKGYFLVEEGQKIGYLCIDFDGEPAYVHLQGEWGTGEPYAAVHRMAFSPDARGKGWSSKVIPLIEDFCRRQGIRFFRADTDEKNLKMRHILEKNGFTFRGTIWFDYSAKIAFDKSL